MSQRVLKFRAWEANEKKFYFWGFRNGGFTHPPIRNRETIDEVLEHTQQFTGLYDKNGKEIYEGDIVNCWDWGGESRLICVSEVYWDNDDKGWGLTPDPTDGDRYDLFRNIEVIGNIHENPELLK